MCQKKRKETKSVCLSLRERERERERERRKSIEERKERVLKRGWKKCWKEKGMVLERERNGVGKRKELR